MSEKIVAVTGLAGYVGQALWPYLEQDPGIERVIGVDQRPLPEMRSDKLTFHQIDVRDARLADALAGADVVVHLAFMLMRRPGVSDAECDAINIGGAQAVFQTAARQGVRKLIFTSSVVAYGLHPDNPIPLSEESPLRPNPDLYYSRAKAAIERELDGLAAGQPDRIVTRLRPCTVVGPRADPAQMAMLVGPTALTVRGFDPPYQLLHEDDLAQAIHLVIQQDAPGVYNVTSDEPQTLGQLARMRGARVIALPYGMVRGLMGLLWRTGRSVFAPEWANLARYPLVASNERLKRLGWAPRAARTTAEALRALLPQRGTRGEVQ